MTKNTVLYCMYNVLIIIVNTNDYLAASPHAPTPSGAGKGSVLPEANQTNGFR